MAKSTIVSLRRPAKAGLAWLPVAAGSVWLLLVYVFGGADMLQWGVRASLRGLLPLCGGLALSLLPGLALLRALWREDAGTWLEQLALAWCISTALPPLLLQLAELVGLPWNAGATWVYLGVSAGALAWLSRRQLTGMRPAWRGPDVEHAGLLGGMIGIGLLVRLFVVRDLPVGMWGDSYHHTMIAQLLVDHGGLFTSWEPYAPLSTFTYHYGFHANAAFFHWLTGVPVVRSVVVVGQIVNLASIAAAYPLTTRLTNSRAAGLWAVALTGFVNPQPIYYFNWGRYTQLTGHVILVAVLVCWWVTLEQERWDWQRMVLAAIVTACLMLTHYIVTIVAALFLAAYVLALIVRSPQRSIAIHTLGRAATIASIAVVLAAPWLVRTLSGFLGRNLGGVAKPPAAVTGANSESLLLAINPVYLTGALLALALLGFLIALSRRDWRTAMFGVWSQLLVLSVVPHVFGLPGTGVITQFTSYIGLYLPALPLAGYALARGQKLLDRLRPPIGRWLAGLAIVTLSVWALGWQQQLLEPGYQLFTPADAQAMTWITANTPDDAAFAVNMMPAYGDTLFAGTDGGWWIPLLTGRATTLPPITYGSERASTPDYAERINALGFALREHRLPSDAGVQLLRDHGINYVYSGAHVGQPDPFDVAALSAHPAFKVVYDRDGVTIFELGPK